MNVLKGLFKGIWRNTGPVVIGAALSAFLQTPYGLIATPALKGIAEAYKQYLKSQGKEIPTWFTVLPF